MQKSAQKKIAKPVENTKEYEPTFIQEGYNLFFANKSNVKQFVIFLFNGNVGNAMKCYKIIREFHNMSVSYNNHMQNYVAVKNQLPQNVYRPWHMNAYFPSSYCAIRVHFPSTICDECLRTCKNLFYHRFCHNCLSQYPPYVSCLRIWTISCFVFVYEKILADYKGELLENVIANDYLVAQITQFL
jgi:hypothetical protein